MTFHTQLSVSTAAITCEACAYVSLLMAELLMLQSEKLVSTTVVYTPLNNWKNHKITEKKFCFIFISHIYIYI